MATPPPLNEEIESENVINDDHLLGRALGLGQTMPPPRCKTTVFRRATNGPLTKFEVEWQKTDFGPKTEFSGGLNGKIVSAGVLVICPVDTVAIQNKNWTFGLKYPNFGVKIALFRP